MFHMNTKTCSKCGETKPTDCFYADARQSSGLRPNCKDCTKLQHKTKYRSDPNFRARKLATATSYQKGLRRDYQIRILTLLKKSGCIDCDEKDPIVLDFDHLGNKTAGISHMVRNHYSWEEIEAEIAKCVVRCSNCHRRKTAKERNYYSDIDLASL